MAVKCEKKRVWIKRCFVISLHFPKLQTEWISASSKLLSKASKNLRPLLYFKASTTHSAPLPPPNTHTHTEAKSSQVTKDCPTVRRTITRGSLCNCIETALVWPLFFLSFGFKVAFSSALTHLALSPSHVYSLHQALKTTRFWWASNNLRDKASVSWPHIAEFQAS